MQWCKFLHNDVIKSGYWVADEWAEVDDHWVSAQDDGCRAPPRHSSLETREYLAFVVLVYKENASK
ncbi:hypothetical protein SERLA73DRAFT_134742 [Serpula lacrymans var. lacrymans S7.3]|uniref:Uncharacterized protein n=2 Tax=Serpula lacrymans var. lacrymans TaxID=341189 RepID=F8PT21_SERL3|nr:uncharacterized protein SERLADRAFT_386453 [Serpula lacrymans var. lacrymans S7.9]EGO01396.1 hypothetical protein SERLA73DRAFT_134742 [Serpula lacrymans var. lacrymans S7.3]EGO27023.1 hypothetical protein SERLADRAFT_386453 [Serpula lacrymans var. lacrymans S7.9]